MHDARRPHTSCTMHRMVDNEWRRGNERGATSAFDHARCLPNVSCNQDLEHNNANPQLILHCH
jgi:hypothetical protein